MNKFSISESIKYKFLLSACTLSLTVVFFNFIKTPDSESVQLISKIYFLIGIIVSFSYMFYAFGLYIKKKTSLLNVFLMMQLLLFFGLLIFISIIFILNMTLSATNLILEAPLCLIIATLMFAPVHYFVMHFFKRL